MSTADKTVEYVCFSKHLTSKVEHELLFSFKQRKFLKPYKPDKYDGKLYYRLLQGNYLKFSLHALKKNDYARFSLVHVYISPNGEVEEKEVYSVELSYSKFREIAIKFDVPYQLKEFVRMEPEYHQTAKVDESNYSASEDTLTIANNIMKYLERKVTS
jgi:hypothetical protein